MIALKDKIFQRLFEAAEIAKFSPEEREAYEESLKYYKDLKNVVDTSREAMPIPPKSLHGSKPTVRRNKT